MPTPTKKTECDHRLVTTPHCPNCGKKIVLKGVRGELLAYLVRTWKNAKLDVEACKRNIEHPLLEGSMRYTIETRQREQNRLPKLEEHVRKWQRWVEWMESQEGKP